MSRSRSGEQRLEDRKHSGREEARAKAMQLGNAGGIQRTEGRSG